MTEVKKPKFNDPNLQKEVDKVDQQFDHQEQEIKSMTHDKLKLTPKEELEPQTKIAQRDLEKTQDIYLKPKRSYPSREKFNERFRSEYEYAKEYVCFIAENNEIRGESIELTLKKFPGTPIEDWIVPTNKPVWAPRMVAERIKECNYHRLVMMDRPTSQEGGMVYYGTLQADTTIQRLDARPVSKNKSIFMGSTSF